MLPFGTGTQRIPKGTLSFQTKGTLQNHFSIQTEDHELTTCMTQFRFSLVSKWELKFSNFTTVFAQFLQQEGFNVTIEPEFEAYEGKSRIKQIHVTSTILETFQFLIPKPQNWIFGFTQQVFPRDETVSDLRPDEDFYNSLSDDAYPADVPMFTIYKETMEIDTKELTGLPSLKTLFCNCKLVTLYRVHWRKRIS